MMSGLHSCRGCEQRLLTAVRECRSLRDRWFRKSCNVASLALIEIRGYKGVVLGLELKYADGFGILRNSRDEARCVSAGVVLMHLEDEQRVLPFNGQQSGAADQRTKLTLA